MAERSRSRSPQPDIDELARRAMAEAGQSDALSKFLACGTVQTFLLAVWEQPADHLTTRGIRFWMAMPQAAFVKALGRVAGRLNVAFNQEMEHEQDGLVREMVYSLGLRRLQNVERETLKGRKPWDPWRGGVGGQWE